jgi:hypothetical protein
MIRPAPMALVLLAALLGACGSGEEAGAPAPTLAEVEPRAPELAPPPPTRCAHYSEERLVFWGDLHVHREHRPVAAKVQHAVVDHRHDRRLVTPHRRQTALVTLQALEPNLDRRLLERRLLVDGCP